MRLVVAVALLTILVASIMMAASARGNTTWADLDGSQMQKMLQHEGYETSYGQEYALEDIKVNDKYITIINDDYDLYLVTDYGYNWTSENWIKEGYKLEDELNANQTSMTFSLGINLNMGGTSQPPAMIVEKKYPHESLVGTANPETLGKLVVDFSREVDNLTSGNVDFAKNCTAEKRPQYELITGLFK
jgi:hypothetical protein